MNLIPSEEGLKIDDSFSGWFDKNYIHFKYRIKNRKIMLPWIIGVARSIYLIEKIHQHDWLRRRAGELEPFKIGRLKRIISIIKNILISKDIFMDVTTPDLTINSRLLLRDMVATAVKNGLDISLNNEVKRIDKNNNIKSVIGNKETIYAENVAICNGSGIKKFTDVKTKLSYAPISVVDGISEGSDSFVELDFFPQNCINLLTKKKGIGLAGGISMFDKSKCDDYLDRVISKHKLYNNNINEIYRYVGLKTEITFKNEPRGYLYNIVKTDDKIWAIVPGKFTLAFSMAPEFYRRIYNRNPRKYFKTITCDNKKYNVSNTVWEDMLNNKGQEHGIN